VATVRNDPSGQTKAGGGRGTLIIAPRKAAAPAAGAPAAGRAAPSSSATVVAGKK
jgi:lipopolysaccharide export system protein LptA